ncbi:MAG TPA: ADP-dependent glucokinase/phosphofructokinase, partial [Myxococcota bacterium]
LGGGASKQIVPEPEVSAWLDRALASEGEGGAVRLALGGAGAFAANLAHAVGVEASFYSSEPVPQGIADRFAPGVKHVDKTASVSKSTSDALARTNTAAEYESGARYSVAGVDFTAIGNGRVIVGSKAKDVKPGFAGVSDDALRKLGTSTDLFFFAGVHYLTQGSTAEADAADLGRALDVMKRANPKLLRHAQYVVAKAPENEAVVWAALRGHVDSLAMNSVETAPFVDALHDGGLTPVDIDPHLPKESAEDPAHMIESAFAIHDALELKRTALHGFEGDLVISAPGTPGADDPNRQRLALLKARQLASNKAANESGEIKSADDVWPVVASVRGTGLAAVHRFADALQARYGLSDKAREQIVERWWFKDDGPSGTGTTIHFVPSRGIHERAGGTVSLGDTIDAAGLMFATSSSRRPKPLHGSSFA